MCVWHSSVLTSSLSSFTMSSSFPSAKAARQLTLLKYGEALLHQEQSEIFVGDVGFRSHRKGDEQEDVVVRLFNALRPSDDALNQKFGVPDGFEPFGNPEYQSEASYLKAGPHYAESALKCTPLYGTENESS